MNTQYLLVVGDWFIDEYRFVVQHHSDISSYTGPSHYRVVDQAKDLCGAGLVTRILYELRGTQYNLFGLGHWLDSDTGHLEELIKNKSYQEQKDNSQNLLDIKSLFSNYPITRCIRTYMSVTGQFKQLNRVDLESSKPELEEQTEESRVAIPLTNLQLNEKKFDAVIIVDHKKGVVDKKLMDEIKKLGDGNSKKWFVRTKDENIQKIVMKQWPDWLQAILNNNGTVELLAVSPEISCRSYPINGLLTKNGHLAEHAYTLINTLISGEEYKERKIKNVVLTSNKLETVALLYDFCFIIDPPSEIKSDSIKISWSTTFFAALVHEILEEQKKVGEHEKDEEKISKCNDMIKRAMENAYKHRCKPFPNDTASSIPKEEPRMVRKWSEIKENWRMAKEDIGIIKKTDSKTLVETKQLDIWRVSTDLPGYIICIEEKREAIRRIWQKISAFTQREENKHSLCILLEADPGVGKTYLAKCLSEQIQNCKLVQHDITQMIERTDLLDLFDTVANAQARSNNPVFVFVDEINATLGGSPVYGAFLSPLEGGYYMRRGQAVTLKPCIWMFARTPKAYGTKKKYEDFESHTEEKREDFESRMTLIEKINYQSIKANLIHDRQDENLNKDARLEQVYMGAKFIQDTFEDVSLIDEDILKFFSIMDPKKAPGRKIKRLAMSLENVQYGRVRKNNCTSIEWLDTIREVFESAEHQELAKKFKEATRNIHINYVILKEEVRPTGVSSDGSTTITENLVKGEVVMA